MPAMGFRTNPMSLRGSGLEEGDDEKTGEGTGILGDEAVQALKGEGER